MRIRRPRRRPTGTPRPKRTISQAMKDAAKTITKRRQGAKNVLTGMTGRPAPKRRKITGTPRPRTTTPKPPETRQLADMRRMSPNIDTRMKQLSIDRGRTKGAKSSVMDKSLGIDARMAALAKERRAKGQYKSRARVASDARKLGIDARMAALAKERKAKGQYKSRARVASDARKKRENAAKRVTGFRRAMASYLRRRRRRD